MAFSDDAIGFFLQIQDNLSPALATAEQNYYRFVRSLDKYNRQAFRSANQGMEALAEVVESFTALPKQAERAYDDALHRMQAKSKGKTLTQQVDFVFSAKGQKELGRAIGEAVSKVLAKAKLRLTADVPSARSKLFDTSIALRRAYKGQIQPPDMAGMFENLPHFQEGGIVGGQGDIDKVLAMLTPGEMVLPKKVAESLRQMAELGKGQRLAQGLTAAVVDIENLAKGLERVQDLTETGLNPEAVKVYAKGVAALNKRYQDLLAVVGGISDKKLPKFIGVLKDAKGQVDKFAKALDKAGDEGEGTEKTLGKVSKSVKFLATRAGIQDIQAGMKMLTSGTQTALSTLGSGEAVGSFIKSLDRLSPRLGLTREGLFALRTESLETFKRLAPAHLDVNTFGDALADLGEITGKADAKTQELAITLATVRQATNASQDSVTQLAVGLQRLTGGKFGPDALAIIFERGRLAVQGTRVSAEQLYERSLQFAELGGAAFQRLSQEQQVAYTTNLQGIMAGLSTVLGPEGAGEIGELIANAFRGDTEAAGKFLALTNMSIEEFGESLTKAGSDLTPLTVGMQKFTQVGSRGFDILQDVTGVENLKLATLVTQLPQATEALAKQQGVVVTAAAAHKGLGDQAGANLNTFERLRNDINKSLVTWDLWGVKASEVVNVLAEMPAGMALVGLEIVKSLVPALAAVVGGTAKAVWWIGKKIVALGALAFAEKAAAVSTATTGATMGAAAGGLGAMVRGIGAAIGGFLTSLASGLVALTPAIPVILVLSVAMVALGAALWLAKEPLVAMFDFLKTVVGAVVTILGKALDAIVTLVISLKDMDPGRLARLAAGLLLLGPAFISLGVGVLALSVSLGASTAGFAAFQGTMALLGGSLAGGASSISALVASLANTFAVDPALLARALAGVQATTNFLVEFAAVAAVLVGLAAGATIASAVDTIFEWFGVDSPLKQLETQSENIAQAMRGVTATFSVLGDVLGGKEAGVVRAMAVTGNILMHLSILAVQLSALSGTVGGMDTAAILRTGHIAETVIRSAGGIRQTLSEALAKAMGTTEVPVVSLQARVEPAVTRAMVEQAIMVKLDPGTTDEPVRAELEKVNSLLEQLLSAFQSERSVRAVPVTVPPRGRPVGPFTQGVAEGKST